MLPGADNLPPSGSLCDGTGKEFGHISAEVTVLHQPNSWDPAPPETREEYVMIGLAMGALAEDTMPWADRIVTYHMFKADKI